jgi:hypothetical protein
MAVNLRKPAHWTTRERGTSQTSRRRDGASVYRGVSVVEGRRVVLFVVTRWAGRTSSAPAGVVVTHVRTFGGAA